METLNDIYRSIVEPHFNYCCSVWGCSGITRIESLQKLQNRAARIVTGSSYDAPSVPLRKELGWLSVKEMIVKETSRGGHVPMGTVVLGLSPKLAFFSNSGPALSPKVVFFCF